jgi:hypothetical protein
MLQLIWPSFQKMFCSFMMNALINRPVFIIFLLYNAAYVYNWQSMFKFIIKEQNMFWETGPNQLKH